VKQPTRIEKVLAVEDRGEALRFITGVVGDAFGSATLESARTLAAAKVILERTEPDLVVLDLHLPDGPGASLLPFIRERHPGAWVVVFTVFDDDEHLFVALQEGADGYLLKDESRPDAARLLREILDGKPPLSARVARRVLRFVQSSPPPPKPKVAAPSLTAREKEVLQLIASGHTAGSAATELGISEHTVRSHVKALYRKLDVSTRASLVRAAMGDGLA
jgi:DNA-binding NarL/FixJ family response regulator